jgi:transposase
MRAATKTGAHPNNKQEEKLTKAFHCAPSFCNNSLNESQNSYPEAGKGLDQCALNARFSRLKQEFDWLGETQCCQASIA